jgi:hypothetical protein
LHTQHISFWVQGGLPTFLDIGQSFSASAITEDNLLQQLLAHNKSLVSGLRRRDPASSPTAPADTAWLGCLAAFTSSTCTQTAHAISDACDWLQCGTQVMMGDDTWMQLAQHAFTEAYPYPSFNVHDLHTVDDGVWEVR